MARALLVALSIALLSTQAHADDRDGFVLGSGVAVGAMDFDEAGDGISDRSATGLWLVAGGMVTPRLAWLLELFQMTGSGDDPSSAIEFDVSQTSLATGVRFWPWTRLWLQGAIGRAWAHAEHANPSFTPELWTQRAQDGAMFSLAVGVEFLRWRSWSLDLAYRVSAAAYRNNNLSSSNGSASLAWHRFW